ncbi:unnamed protein product [Rotaria sp. Silwood1]|nr:unnamed protein product [Rotaria sp. Silwood1]CAF1617672.1 unnamed protein product [Rotaria sp. Silwood1]CAF3753056.1 unnamed protein product [Rotaria sp. Silwood1]
MPLKQNHLTLHILTIIILYLLQGFVQGFTASIQLYLAFYKASWQEQGIFSWTFYPFSLKILWAPILDSIYHYRFGRYLTWLIPIQITIGIIFIILSFYLESLLINRQIVTLTIIFFFIYFLIASQDVVVDGLSVLLFANLNPQWASTCQTIGQVIGYFLSSTVLIIFESSNFTNEYIRKPLSLPERSSGLFSLQEFTFFGGAQFIIVNIIILVIFFPKKSLNKTTNVNIQKIIYKKLDLSETYSSILKLFRKKCMCEYAVILLTFDIGFAATNYMTILSLLEYGITRDTIALLNIPPVAIHIVVPLFMSQIQRHLQWFAYGYIFRLISAVVLAIYIYFIPDIVQRSYFYPVLIILFCVNQAAVYMMVVSRVGFSARISEPQIAGTYMTLLATISNLGQSFMSTLVLYIASWLPASHVYSIEVAGCVLLVGNTAIKIQGAFRNHHARSRLKNEALRDMFEKLLKALDTFSLSVIKLLQKPGLPLEKELLKLTNPDDIQVEANYRGSCKRIFCLQLIE